VHQKLKFCCIFGISQKCVTKETCSKLFKQLPKSDAVICNRVEILLYVFASYLGIQKNALWVTWNFAMYVKNTLSANHESKLVTFLGPPKSANQVKPTLNWILKLAFIINRTGQTSHHRWIRDWPGSERPRVFGPQQARDRW
jgi:hypothetical protein